MNKLQLPIQLFDLTKEQEEISKQVYGKIIRCLVAPYHSYMQLEAVLPYTNATYLFPEREMSYKQTRGFITMVASSMHSDVKIVTSSMTIIGDMIGDCVRILTEKNQIVDCDIKTFMANIHDIRYKVLEEKSHALSDEENHLAHQKVDKLIKRINSSNPATKEEYEQLQARINEIGEPIIANQLMSMLRRQIQIK